MGSFESSEYEDIFRYAFALGFKHHLREFSSRFTTKLLSMSDELNAILGQYALKDLQVVTDYGVNPYIEQVKQNLGVNNQPDNLLLFRLDSLLLGPDIQLFDVPSKLTTNDIIDKIEHSDEHDSGYVISSAREADLAKRMYLILKEVLHLNWEQFQIENLNQFDTLSAYSAFFINQAVSRIPVASSLHSLVVEKLASATTLLAGDLTSEINVEQVYPFFKKFLTSHLNIINYDMENEEYNVNLILKLREQANNLMANQAFAQAIKVCTQAIDLSNSKAVAQIPQLYTNRAIAYIGLNCFPEAITDLNQAVDFDWSFTPAWAQLGYCHLYMGSSLLALKSYLFALKTAIGEVAPRFLPSSEYEEYKQNKIKSVLPQFVQRLCLAISLTERRANQQKEPPLEIRRVISEVRRILAVLRAEAIDEDERQFFTYVPQLREPNLRIHSERANRARPNILTQDVSQNMLASNGMESVTVTTTPFQRGPANTTTVPAATTTPAAAEPASETTTTTNENTRNERAAPNSGESMPVNSIREFMNEFGDFIEERTNRANFLATPNATTENSTTETTGARPESVLSEVLRGVLPAGIGSVISQLASGNGVTSRISVNGQEVTATNSNVQSANANAQSEHATPRANSDGDEEMPGAEDLD